jgi:hypothetical protein
VVGLFKHLVRGFESSSRLDERSRLSVVLPFVDRGIMICGKGPTKHLKDLVESKGFLRWCKTESLGLWTLSIAQNSK